jgi:3-phosphoshikimate 1-carboxyvinyltransferase
MRFVTPSAVSGRLRAPASKSHTLRAVLAAALAEGESSLLLPSRCDDALAGLRVARALGADLEVGEESVRIFGGRPPRDLLWDCGESGLLLRASCALAALHDREVVVTGSGSLLKRPVDMVVGPLVALGASCAAPGRRPPVRVKGPLKGGEARVEGAESSQALTGLLLALPLCPGDSVLRVANLRSKPYVAMTLQALEAFGGRVARAEDFSRFEIRGGQRYRPAEVGIEGDWSGAAFLLVAGAVAGEVTLEGLDPLSAQADRAIVQALEAAGARVAWDAGALSVCSAPLRAFETDATDCPDLFPPLAVLACACEGRTVIRGARRLRHKESDRAEALRAELGKLGADIEVRGDLMFVEGRRLRGGEVDPRGDHRIAIAAAVAALTSVNGVQIVNESCVAKSYPHFFEDLESVRVMA